MLPANDQETKIDRFIQPMLEEHVGETGLVLLDDNLDAFALRAIGARDAERSLDLQYYIWNNDLTGNLLGHELIKAADRGVKIRLLLDDLNTHDKDTLLVGLDQHKNIEVRLFNPSYSRGNKVRRIFELMFRGFSLNRRMHNKAWIIDSRIAIVGGRNIGDEYFDASSQANFFDVDVLLTGNAVSETLTIFDTFWNSSTAIALSTLIKMKHADKKYHRFLRLNDNIINQTNIYKERIKNSSTIQAFLKGSRPIHWTKNTHVYSDPPEKAYGLNKDRWLIKKLHPVWLKAESDLKLISPYFVPGKEGMELLTDLRYKKVAVSVLTNSLAATDVMLVHSGYAPYRKSLLQKGIKLYELMPFNVKKKKLLGSSAASLHTKAFIIDG